MTRRLWIIPFLALASCMSRGDFARFATRHRPVAAATLSFDLYKKAAIEENYREAEKQLRDALEADRDFVRAWRRLQDIQVATFRRGEAVAEAEREIQQFPTSARPYYLLARLRQGEARKNLLKKALDLDPWYGWARMALAVHEDTFTGDGAGLGYALQATELLPQEPEPWLVAIRSLAAAGQFDRLQPVLARAVTQFGKTEPEILEVLVRYLHSARRSDPAAGIFTSGDVLRLLPELLQYAPAVRALASAVAAGGSRARVEEMEDAVEGALRAAGLRPDLERSLRVLSGELLYQSGNPTRARAEFERAFRLGERSPRLLRTLRFLRVATRDYAGALALEDDLIRDFALAAAAGLNQDLEGLRDAGRRAAERPGDAASVARFAEAAAKYGWIDECVELVTQAALAAPENGEIISLQKRLQSFGRFLSKMRMQLERGSTDAMSLMLALEPYRKISLEALGADAVEGSKIEDYFPVGSLLDTKPGAPGLPALFEPFGLELRLGKRLGGPVEAFMMRRVAIRHIDGEILGRPYRGREVIGEGTRLFTQIEGISGPFAGATLPGSIVIVLDAVAESAERVERELTSYEDDRRAGRGDDWKKEYLPIAGSRAELLAIDETLDASRRLIRRAIDRDPSPLRPRALELVRFHEYGHLADAGQFLPLIAQVPRILSWLVRGGFSVKNVEARLEMRAELTAMCTTRDPELSLAFVLEHCDRPLASPPHSTGFTALASEFVRELDRRVRAGQYPRIDARCPLLPQVWKLEAEQIRDIACALAENEGVLSGKRPATGG